ncbi:MAG: HPr family phosphocarrier protein [Butyribacter sp.]|nr:HPr family phosphocarrier protein [bacterium]MDY3853578.1 HPr family phosphocarrier protein [Butyribacter sp.]
MKEFSYVITDEIGIHARPAGMLVKEAKKYESKIVLTKDGKSAEATKLMAIMSLGVKCGETVQVTIEGADEEAACEEMTAFFKENL